MIEVDKWEGVGVLETFMPTFALIENCIKTRKERDRRAWNVLQYNPTIKDTFGTRKCFLK